MKQTIFITGGCGYVGSATTRALLRLGYNVVVFDHSLYTFPRSYVSHGVSVRGDICHGTFLSESMSRYHPFMVIHLAAKTSVSQSERYKRLYTAVNIEGTRNVLRAMQASGCTRILFASSAAVYGACTTKVDESYRLSPASFYGETKKQAEIFIQKEKRIQSVIFRYFNIVGDESIIANDKLIPTTLRIAYGMQKTLFLYGRGYNTSDGSAIRDYVHLRDVVQANCAAVTYMEKKRTSLVCNIGSGCGTSNDTVVRTVKHLYTVSIPVRFRKQRKETAVSIADITRAKHTLHWMPRASDLTTIIKSYTRDAV